ncbi:hypothetical protein FRC07_001261 [Ceratobasidium sp. 392]|nr:hypothetical protein FRC07_001261 [Ceratobasidium sp. 392]
MECIKPPHDLSALTENLVTLCDKLIDSKDSNTLVLSLSQFVKLTKSLKMNNNEHLLSDLSLGSDADTSMDLDNNSWTALVLNNITGGSLQHLATNAGAEAPGSGHSMATLGHTLTGPYISAEQHAIYESAEGAPSISGDFSHYGLSSNSGDFIEYNQVNNNSIFEPNPNSLPNLNTPAAAPNSSATSSFAPAPNHPAGPMQPPPTHYSTGNLAAQWTPEISALQNLLMQNPSGLLQLLNLVQPNSQLQSRSGAQGPTPPTPLPQPQIPLPSATTNPSNRNPNWTVHRDPHSQYGSEDSFANPGLSSSRSHPPTSSGTLLTQFNPESFSANPNPIKPRPKQSVSSATSSRLPRSSSSKLKGRAVNKDTDRSDGDQLVEVLSSEDENEGKVEDTDERVFEETPPLVFVFVLPRAELDEKLSKNRFGLPWEIWEKHIIIIFFVGPDAPEDRWTTALDGPKTATNNATLHKIWHQLSSEGFRGQREPRTILPVFWALVSAYHDILKLDGFTGGGGHGDAGSGSSSLAARLGKKPARKSGKKGKICDWEVKLWKTDPENGWFGLMHGRVNGHPAVVRSGDFRSGVISPRRSARTRKSGNIDNSITESGFTNDSPPIMSPSNHTSGGRGRGRAVPSQLSRASLTKLEPGPNSTARQAEDIRQKRAVNDEELKLKKQIADSTTDTQKAEAEMYWKVTGTVTASQGRKRKLEENTAKLDAIERVTKSYNNYRQPLIDTAMALSTSSDPEVKKQAQSFLTGILANPNDTFVNVILNQATGSDFKLDDTDTPEQE